MPKFFTLRQAEKVLPQVESAIREALELKSHYARAESEWRSLAGRVTLQGGMQVDRARWAEQKKRRESAAEELQNCIGRVQEFGCLVKDLDIGLIDFPTLFNGAEVYLCWKLGESGIQFWHGVHEGFRGRKAIDQDFLLHHSSLPEGAPPD
jgi:hypothetical protein